MHCIYVCLEPNVSVQTTSELSSKGSNQTLIEASSVSHANSIDVGLVLLLQVAGLQHVMIRPSDGTDNAVVRIPSVGGSA
jgi:hypothetical protein